MNLHANIASMLWSSFKGAPKLHIGYFETTLHLGIAFEVALSLPVLPKSPMVILLNTAIAFRVRISYNFTISTHVLTFPN